MIKIVDECVDCTDIGLPCKGIGCPNREVERHYCDDCKVSEAVFEIDGIEFCESCAADHLDKLWRNLTLDVQAEMFGLRIKGLDD